MNRNIGASELASIYVTTQETDLILPYLDLSTVVHVCSLSIKLRIRVRPYVYGKAMCGLEEVHNATIK